MVSKQCEWICYHPLLCFAMVSVVLWNWSSLEAVHRRLGPESTNPGRGIESTFKYNMGVSFLSPLFKVLEGKPKGRPVRNLARPIPKTRHAQFVLEIPEQWLSQNLESDSAKSADFKSACE